MNTDRTNVIITTKLWCFSKLEIFQKERCDEGSYTVDGVS